MNKAAPGSRRQPPTTEQPAAPEAEQPKPTPAHQFVFSNPEIEAELHRRLLLEEAQKAGQHAAEPEKSPDFPVKLAA